MSENKISNYFTSTPSRGGKRQRANSSPELEQGPGRRAKMEREAVIGNLTFGQLMDGLSGLFDTKLSALLDTKLSTLATRQDFLSLTGEVSKLTEENKALKLEIEALKRNDVSFMAKLDDLESRSRRNNLIFRGLKWSSSENVDFKAMIKKFCAEFFGCDENRLWVNRAHPLGKVGGAVIAHFPDDADVNYIMSNTKRLKGSGYVVHRDFTRDVRLKRAMLTAVRSEVERVGGKQRIPLVFDALILRDCRFTWEDSRLMMGKDDGAEKLREMFGQDFAPFLTALARNGPAGRRSKPRQQTETTTGQSLVPPAAVPSSTPGLVMTPSRPN